MVLLKHTLPRGGWHYDWLLATSGDETGDGAHMLVAFRVYVDISVPSAAAFVAMRLDDHRGEYLHYEGEIPGNRGQVERIAVGTCRLDTQTDTVITGGIGWEGQPVRWFEAMPCDQHWRVRVLATDRPPALRRRGWSRR